MDLVLLSVEAVDARHGVTAASLVEAEIARRWVAAGRSVCGVALEGTAVGRVALHGVVGLDGLDRLLVARTAGPPGPVDLRDGRPGPEVTVVDVGVPTGPSA